MKLQAHRIAGGRLAGALLVLALLLTGCADSPPWGGWSKGPTSAQVAAAMDRHVATFIYFSRYEVYQNERTKEYVYQDGHWWIHSAVPPVTIAEATLQASPSVKVTLSGEIAREHAAVRQAYPSDWRNPAEVIVAAH